MNFFAYGTLKLESVQQRLFGHVKSGRAAILWDHQLVMADEYPSVIRSANSKTPGLILKLNTDEIKAANNWEGQDYLKKTVQVVSKNELVACQIYVSQLLVSEIISQYDADTTENTESINPMSINSLQNQYT